MPQRGSLYDDLSIAENLRFFARAHGLADLTATVSRALQQHGLSERAAQRVASLSGGWRLAAACRAGSGFAAFAATIAARRAHRWA